MVFLNNVFIGLHMHLETIRKHNEKIVYYKKVPDIVKKNYYDLIMDVLLNRGV